MRGILVLVSTRIQAGIAATWMCSLLALGRPTSGAPIAAVTLLDEAQVVAVAHSKAWLRLLHYQPATLGRTRSLVDGPEYFFSPTGKYDALAELKASLAAMHQDQ